MQGYAKQRSYIFVYTWPPINGCGLSVLRDVVVNAREFSDPYGLRVAQLSGSRVVPGDALLRSYVEMPQSRYATSLDVKPMLWSLS